MGSGIFWAAYVSAVIGWLALTEQQPLGRAVLGRDEPSSAQENESRSLSLPFLYGEEGHSLLYRENSSLSSLPRRETLSPLCRERVRTHVMPCHGISSHREERHSLLSIGKRDEALPCKENKSLSFSISKRDTLSIAQRRVCLLSTEKREREREREMERETYIYIYIFIYRDFLVCRGKRGLPPLDEDQRQSLLCTENEPLSSLHRRETLSPLGV